MGTLDMGLLLTIAGLVLSILIDKDTEFYTVQEIHLAALIMVVAGVVTMGLESIGSNIRDGLIEAEKEARKPLKPWEK